MKAWFEERKGSHVTNNFSGKESNFSYLWPFHCTRTNYIKSTQDHEVSPLLAEHMNFQTRFRNYIWDYICAQCLYKASDYCSWLLFHLTQDFIFKIYVLSLRNCQSLFLNVQWFLNLEILWALQLPDTNKICLFTFRDISCVVREAYKWS